MIQLVYTSTPRVSFGADDLRALLALARERNTAKGVTGLLLHVDGSFLQILEGDPDVVEGVYRRIEKDPRHARVITLVRREIEERNFPEWSMNYFEASGRHASLEGYRRATGFADLEGDPVRVRAIIEDFRTGRWRALAA